MTVQRASLVAGKGVWIARHESAAGFAIINRLWREKCSLILASGSQFDLTRSRSLEVWMKEQRPDAVIIADGRLSRGGNPADRREAERRFLGDVLAAARDLGVEKLVHVVPATPPPSLVDRRTDIRARRQRHSGSPAGSFCAHAAGPLPARNGRQGCGVVTLVAPMVYAANWSVEWGPLPLVNELVNSLGLALLRGARGITIAMDCPMLPPMIHADDLADAAAFAADHCEGPAVLRCGPTEQIRAEELARIVVETVGFRGSVEIRYRQAAQGMAAEPSDGSLESLGWQARVPLRDGIVDLYHAWFKRQAAARSGAFLLQ